MSTAERGARPHATAGTGTVACVQPEKTTRRGIIVAGAVGAGALLAPGARAAVRRDPTARAPALLARGGAFPQGVMAGQPNLRAITLWTKLARPERPGPLVLELSRDAGFARTLLRQRIAVDPETGIARARVRSRRLAPGEHYFYRWRTADGSSPVGRFKTLRPADSAEPVRVGVFSCQMFFLGYFNGHTGLAEEDLDLVVCLGDYVYDTYLDLVRTEPKPTGASGTAETLAEYRAKFAAYRSDPQLRAMHAAHSFLPVWDDHEVTNDYDGDAGPAGGRGTSFAERRANAYRAWFEHMPVQRPPRQRDRVYRRVRLGRHLDLFALDARQYRDPAASLLGPAQQEWLTEGLARSRASWKLIGSPVPMFDLNGPGSVDVTGASAGSWQAFPKDRRALGEAVLARGIEDVAVVSGDAHAFYTGTNTTLGGTAGRPFATEFCAGTLAASNSGTSAFESLAPASVPALSAADLRANPHLVHSDPVEHGYAVIEAGSDALEVTYRAVGTIQTEGSPVRNLARFEVPRGTVRVDRRF